MVGGQTTGRLLAVSFAVAEFLLASGAFAAPFREPPVFASRNGLLDIMMIAKPKPIEAIDFVPPGGAPIHPTGWVYEICYRMREDQTTCPDAASSSSEFGGVRLALQKGDLLKVRLVNKLPAQDKAKVSHYWNLSLPSVPDMAEINLPLTPTNLHTHGLVVEARAPSRANPTWGDDIYVDLYNPENGRPAPQRHQHGAVVDTGVLNYEIAIPRNEPSGSDWFHPHVHGITADSLSSGLAGIISIGGVNDYLAGGWKSGSGFPESQVRYLTLKDMQVLAAGAIQFEQGTANVTLPVSNGEVLDDQQDPAFCAQYPSGGEPRRGSCPGADNTSAGGDNYTGGRWYFPVSGTVFPTIEVDRPGGEIWRISNIGASAT